MTHKTAFEIMKAQTPAGVLSQMVEVNVARVPEGTVVFIDGVELPKSVEALNLPRGKHALRARIDGVGGDKGVATVEQDGATLCTVIALIPAGFDHAHSAEGSFDV